MPKIAPCDCDYAAAEQRRPDGLDAIDHPGPLKVKNAAVIGVVDAIQSHFQRDGYCNSVCHGPIHSGEGRVGRIEAREHSIRWMWRNDYNQSEWIDVFDSAGQTGLVS